MVSDEAHTQSLASSAASAIANEPGVLAGWIFGSRACGDQRASSDLDVAVLLTPRAEGDLLARLSAGLTRSLGIDVDVIDLAACTPVLGFEIVARGRRIFTRDATLADEAEERCLREYLDTEYMRRVQNHYLYGDPL